MDDLNPVLFMKIGPHADEGLGEIINRKREDIESFGFAFWGYGGSICHPARQVQPLAFSSPSKAVKVLFIETRSNPYVTSERSKEFSSDGESWSPIDGGFVSGSKWALTIAGLERANQTIDLSEFEVASGPSRGKLVSLYMRGRCDKACAYETEPNGNAAATPVRVVAVATLVPPYAVFLR